MLDLKSGQKRLQLEEELKNEIISGKLKPGERFPTYEELSKRYEASRATFHYVLNHLKRDLYTVSVERSGTFVSKRLPCRTRIGMVFRLDENENEFWHKIYQAAMRYNRTHSDYEFVVFRSRILQVPLKEEYHELQDQLSRKMLASLFFPFIPESKNLLSLLDEFPEIPRILFASAKTIKKQSTIYLSPEHSVRLAVKYFKQEGIQRIAAIARGNVPQLSCFQKEVENGGLQTCREWLVPVTKDVDFAIENFTKLLLSLPPDRRPQGFYITDDHLLTQVQRAVIASGIRVPQELKLVCHTNFPDPMIPVLPVERVGYNVEAIAQAIIRLTDMHYAGVAEQKIIIPAEYERDVADPAAKLESTGKAVNH